MEPGYQITWHSHIKTLTANKPGFLEISLIGQSTAIHASSLIVNLVKKNKLEGRAIFFSGPLGSGKTALAFGIAQELGESTPFHVINGSEIFSLNIKKTSLLYEKCRKAIGIKLFEKYNFYEGEVVEISWKNKEELDQLPYSFVIVVLKTIEGSLKIKLLDSLYDNFIFSKIKNGDIIRIDPENCSIRVLGRSVSFFNGKIEEKNIYVTIPKGKVFKKKTLVRETTLFDLDCMNLFNSKKKKIDKIEKTDQLYNEVNLLVSNYIQRKKAELVPGVLFIDEAHFLDCDSFSFLSKVLDSPFTPIVILATNRMCYLKSLIFPSFIVPGNFIDRCLIVKTRNYSKHEISRIISLKSKENGTFLSGKSFQFICTITKCTSLRFAILLVNCSYSFIYFTPFYTINFCVLRILHFLFFHIRGSQQLLDAAEPSLKIFRVF